MSTQRILAQLDRLSAIIAHHDLLLTDLEVNLPQHESTVAVLRQQFEAHISFLLVNVESYTTLQQSITSTIREHPEHIEITAAVVVPNPITSVEFITHPSLRAIPLLRSTRRAHHGHLHQLARLFSSN